MLDQTNPSGKINPPKRVTYSFNSWSTTCAYEPGQDCLTAALRDVMSWSVPESLRATPLPNDAGGGARVYELGMYYPSWGAPGPHHLAVLRIPNTLENIAIDATSYPSESPRKKATAIVELINCGSLFPRDANGSQT